jgi:SAM-dependent methyltransferase
LTRSDSPAKALVDLREHVAAMPLTRSRSEWGDYEAPGGAYDDLESYSEKAVAVRAFLEPLEPGRLVDIGCNRGWFSGLASAFGHEVLGIDVDENALTAAWKAGTPGESGFDLAHLSIVWPTPRQGLLAQLPSSFERWTSDTVMMISVAHHIILRQKLGFEGIAAIPNALGARNFIIEWVPPGDRHVRGWPERFGLSIPEWYREDAFVETMTKSYSMSSRAVSWSGPEGTAPEDRRILYLFQR